MRADLILLENIGHLLRKRGYQQKDLADWCGHSAKWISQILNGERHLRVVEYDKIADFFGLAVYQLFQPGISPLTERRKRGERRSGEDRRVSHQQRMVLELAKKVEPHRPRRRAAHANDEAED